MFPSIFVQTLLLSSSFASSALAQNNVPLSDVSDPTQRAELALSALQIWYDARSGLWTTTGWWNSASAMTTLANLAKVDKNPQLQTL